jgi:hypothetical protein
MKGEKLGQQWLFLGMMNEKNSYKGLESLGEANHKLDQILS